MSQEMIIALGVCAIAIAVMMMAYFLIAHRKNQQKRVLSIIAGRSGTLEAEDPKDAHNKRRADLAKKLQQGGDPAKAKKKGGLQEKLMQAGLETPVRKFWIYSAVFACVMTILLVALGQPKIVIILGFITSLLGLPRFFLRIKIARRQKKFLEDFADALESIVRLLKAGMPVGEAVSMVAREFTGPVGEEMAKIYDEQKIGIPLPEACVKAAERMPITEMQMFATGITIQQQTGSSLSEILSNLARVIRARFRLKRKVSALSAEAKASAAIIGALPVIVAGGLYIINPKYMDPLFYTMTGKFYLFGAIGWMCVGILIMRQMINFKV